MYEETPGAAAAETLLEVDSKVRDAVIPHHQSDAVKAVSWLSEIGDQPQVRMLSGGMVIAGLVRSDKRLIRAGARMLLSHEAATIMKNYVKHRVDRSRPRSAAGKDEQKPRAGRSEEKEKTSFPSGHSAGPMAAARAFAAEYPEHRGPALATAGAVAVAQIPRCAHYPTDVGAGLAIGLVAEAAVGIVWRAAAAALPNDAPLLSGTQREAACHGGFEDVPSRGSIERDRVSAG